MVIPSPKETTPFYSRSPYRVAKLYGYWITVNYREAYGMFGSNGILVNHESPIRSETFVTRKISRGVSRIEVGLDDTARRGASCFMSTTWQVPTFHLMKTYSGAELVNIGTGEDITIAEFAHLVAEIVGYSGEISFDTSRPDGAPRKLLDVGRLDKLAGAPRRCKRA